MKKLDEVSLDGVGLRLNYYEYLFCLILDLFVIESLLKRAYWPHVSTISVCLC